MHTKRSKKTKATTEATPASRGGKKDTERPPRTLPVRPKKKETEDDKETTDHLVERVHGLAYRVTTGVARAYSTHGSTPLDLRGVDEQETAELHATTTKAEELVEGLQELERRVAEGATKKSGRARR